MTWPQETQRILRVLAATREQLRELFTGRERVVDVLALGLVCHEHVLLLGPPGTGKSELLARFAAEVDAPRFHYLLTRFTEPSELFGPMDLAAFNEGRFQVRTEGMLPSAVIAFLDEVFQGSSAILNTLLTLVHERVFYNGPQPQSVPLLTLVGASNELPDDPTLRAFADRFALRVQIEPVPDERLDELLDRGWSLEIERMERDRRRAEGQSTRTLAPLKEAHLRQLHRHLSEVSLDRVRPLYGQALRELRAEGVELSDRRRVKGLKLVAGAALLAGRTEATAADLWPLLHVWSRPAEAPVYERIAGAHLAGTDAAPETRRGVADLADEISLLEGQGAALRSEAAVGAHLMALNRVRRELLLRHPGEAELRRRVEAVIGRVMSRLEDAGV